MLNGTFWMVNVTVQIPDCGMLERDVDRYLSDLRPLTKLALKAAYGREYNVFDRYEVVSYAEVDGEIFDVVKGDVEVAFKFAYEDLKIAELVIEDIFRLAASYGFVMNRANIRRNLW